MKFIDELIARATAVREHAHAHYSGFAVGAAIAAADGRIFVGCNVENVSFGLTICAERVAIGSAIAAGAREFEAIAIVTGAAQPTVPCGACRQVLAEFSPSMRIVSATTAGATEEFSLDTLLPNARQGILQ